MQKRPTRFLNLHFLKLQNHSVNPLPHLSPPPNVCTFATAHMNQPPSWPPESIWKTATHLNQHNPRLGLVQAGVVLVQEGGGLEKVGGGALDHLKQFPDPIWIKSLQNIF